jgi:hypothetical protein
VRLQDLQGHAGPDADLCRLLVELLDPVEPAETEHHLAVPRRTAANQPAVAPLRNDGYPSLHTQAQHLGDLDRVTRPNHEQRLTKEPTREVTLVAQLQPGIDEHVFVPDDAGQPFGKARHL